MPVKAKSHPPKRKAAHASVPPPKWPAFHPLVATSDLSLETLLDDQILVIRSLFTSTLCKNYVSFLSSLPLTTTLGTPKKGDAVRVNDRFEVHDPSFADQLWLSTGLKDLVNGTVSTEDTEDQLITPEERRKLWGGEVCGLNPRIRVYRYSKGQFFDRHYDESNIIVLPSNPPVTAKTTWTLLLYLTGPTTGVVGGETIFYPELGPAKKFSGKTSEGTEPITVGLEV
ncbi:hypothetical protein MMC12_008018, partial [Toensbergia leucococca]|nr:hypothetical protein [Toensbergia leucococca]